jgi:hypothetical protein
MSIEKSFSFHGASANSALITEVNKALMSRVKFSRGSNKVQFALDPTGHFYAAMNHDCQKHHEEDIIVVILDKMEELGWTFQFQWDASSTAMNSATSKEMILFHRKADVYA